MQSNKVRNTLLFFAGIVFAILAGTTLSHSKMENPDGSMSAKTAEAMGLISEKEAPWSGNILFKKVKNGGFDYQKKARLMFISFPKGIEHTNIDIEKECKRLGQCAVLIK